MTTNAQPERPRFTGASVYNHPSGLLSFWYASEWTLQVDATELPSVTLFPDLADPATHIAITVQDIETPLLPDERVDIVDGVRSGLAELESCIPDVLKETDEGSCWGVEWQCTFVCGGQRCRRRARIFFSDRYQYSVVMDGSSEERYAYWQGMFEFTMLTVGAAPFSLVQSAQPMENSGQGSGRQGGGA